MDIKEPAVVFSDRGWKQFLDFMLKMNNGSQTDPEESRLVSDYFARHGSPEKTPNVRKLDDDESKELESLERFLKIHRRGLTASELGELMEDEGFGWSTSPQACGNRLKKFMKHSGRIKKIGHGLYGYESILELEETDDESTPSESTVGSSGSTY